MPAKVPTIKFNNGLSCPALGLGTWKSKPGEVSQAVKDAIDAGYRHFDCAHVYQNEKEVGAGLKAKIDEGVVTREELFITSKLWNTFHKKELVVPACKESLANLGLDYLDLYLVHWPMGFKEGDDLFPKGEDEKMLYSETGYLEAYKGMEECVRLGLVKSIGVSNFNSQQLEAVLNACTIKPVNNQVECHPYLTQKGLIEVCKKAGVTVTAYSPLGSPDRPWAKPEDVHILDDPKLKKLAEKYSKSVAQVIIRYQIDRGLVVIPKSVTKSRIESNIDIFDFSLSPEDIDHIDQFDCNGRICALEWASDHKDYPFAIKF